MNCAIYNPKRQLRNLYALGQTPPRGSLPPLLSTRYPRHPLLRGLRRIIRNLFALGLLPANPVLSAGRHELGIKAANLLFSHPHILVSSLKNGKNGHFFLFVFDFLWNDGILYFVTNVWGISSVG